MRYFVLIAQNTALSSLFPQWLQNTGPVLWGVADLFVVTAESKQLD